MAKEWIDRAIEYLRSSLEPIPHEINELDWKEILSSNSKKLCSHISAFANYAGGGFLVFGIEDKTAKLVGVSMDDAKMIVEKLGSLCRDNVNPMVSFDHAIRMYNDVPLLFIYFRESDVKPVSINPRSIENAYIRSGGTSRLASRQELGAMMLNSKVLHYEELHAGVLKSAGEVIDLLDFRSILKLLNRPTPQSQDEILRWMSDEKMIQRINGSGYYVSNFGALACAFDLGQFDDLARKKVRIIKYRGVSKVETEKEFDDEKGYAVGFNDLIDYVRALLPGGEVIQNGIRSETSAYPEIALRELIANSLIHQDLTVRGAGPMIEIFEDRTEISNPGRLLPTKKIDRLIRTTPESRNEILASAFRRYGICEERGSGLEKAVSAIESCGLPPLRFEEFENSFRVTMYAPKPFSKLTHSERVEACYQHCVIQYYTTGGMTNTSLRERFKLHVRYRPQISVIIKEAVEQKMIKPKDPDNTSTKFIEYIPIWG